MFLGTCPVAEHPTPKRLGSSQFLAVLLQASAAAAPPLRPTVQAIEVVGTTLTNAQWLLRRTTRTTRPDNTTTATAPARREAAGGNYPHALTSVR